MAELVALPKKVGGSLAIFLPAEVVRQEGLEEGKPVFVTVRPTRLGKATDALGAMRGKMPKYTNRGEEAGFDV